MPPREATKGSPPSSSWEGIEAAGLPGAAVAGPTLAAPLSPRQTNESLEDSISASVEWGQEKHFISYKGPAYTCDLVA